MVPRRRPARRLAGFAVLLALVAWSPSIVQGGFAFDDREATLQNPVVTGEVPVVEAFRRDYWHHVGDAGHYRPLATLSLRLDHALWGGRAFGYHVTNVLLHVLVVALAAWALARLRGGGRVALLGLVVFAVHPALADSVAWVSGRTSMLSALGGGIAIVSVVSLRRTPVVQVGATLGLLIGLLAKEDAVVFALPVLLLAAARSRRLALACAFSVAAAVGVYLLMRAGALGAAVPSAPHAPLASHPFLERMLYAGRSLLEGARLLAFPFEYPPNYRAAVGFAAASPPGGWALLGWLPWLALVAGGAWAVVRGVRSGVRRLALVGGSAAVSALSLLPVLQVVPAGEVFAPRFLYLPLLLGAPALGALLRRLPTMAIVILVAFLVVTAGLRSGVYADRGSYAEAVLEHVPADVAALNDLGLALEERGDVEGARTAWREAVRMAPGYSRAWTNLGVRALEEGDLDAAERALRRAVAVGSRNDVAHLNLANLLARRERLEEAETVYVKATRLVPGRAAAWRGLGHVRLRRGDLEGAIQALRRALYLSPSDARTRKLLAEARRLSR